MKKIKVWQFAGFTAVAAIGTLLHFLYDITDSRIAACISSVNESTWEHMKILFFAMLFFTVAESFVLGKSEGFWCIKLWGALIGFFLIPILFYTLQGIFGKTPDIVNISIYFVAAALAFVCETRAFGKKPCKQEKAAIAMLILIAAAFVVFTFFPPKIPLFKDPTDGSFGL